MKKLIYSSLCLLLTFNSFAQREKIIGGVKAGQTEFPFIVGLYDPAASDLFMGQFCGAALIRPNWVLTAGHCVHDDLGNLITPAQVSSAFNIWVLSHPNSGYDTISTRRIVVHPGYNDVTLDNDLALIELNRPSSQPVIRLVGQGDVSMIDPGDSLMVAGWGVTDVGTGDVADTLMKVDLRAISSTVCNDATRYAGDVTSTMFCAGFLAGGRDACSGDSGGPIFGWVGGEWVQTGIVSWGNDCALPDFPGVYTRLPNYIDWINSIVGSMAGIANTNENNDWRISQNRDELQLTRINAGPQTQFSITDISGRELMNRELSESTLIQTGHLPSGIYFAVFHQQNGNQVMKFIKQ